MEAIGHMAEGISNDFNNLLQTINGYSEILLLDKNPDDEQYHYLKEITAAANQATNLISQLLAFSRKFASHRRPEDLNHRVRRFKEALEKKVTSSAGSQPRLHIKMDLADALAKVNADPVQLEQVLCNLADNAIDAGGREVTIQVRTRNTTLDEQFCDAHQGAKPGDYVQLTFRDQGRGMDRGTLRRVFEPFFTTKQSGCGSGMGLAMVYGIVKNHDGYITCQSQLGLGTTFDIYLPALSPAAGNLWREDPADIPGGTETILLVDDEEAIRELSSRMLRSHGYQVVAADSGESALDLFRQDPAKIDLVLLDLAMPGMGGIRCLKEMRTIAPRPRSSSSPATWPTPNWKRACPWGPRGSSPSPSTCPPCCARCAPCSMPEPARRANPPTLDPDRRLRRQATTSGRTPLLAMVMGLVLGY